MEIQVRARVLYFSGSRKWSSVLEKSTTSFFFQIIHPDAISGGSFANDRSQAENIKAVIDNILTEGNENSLLPGQLEAQAAERSEKAGGLLFTDAELAELDAIAQSIGHEPLTPIGKTI